MSILVNGRSVPVVWSPSDLVGPDSDGHYGRYDRTTGRGQVIRAIVHHRVVGTLESMTNVTFKPTLDPHLLPGERRVSSTFGIGLWGTDLRIVQYVALENTAYCNGQTDRDRAACRWPVWIAAGRPDPNTITVSIEHEDNGAAGDYIVVEEIIAASIELDRLLLSGDGPAIRAAKIHCSDAAAAQLGRITPGPDTLIDHRVIAPVTKPYCWAPLRLDKGFPQARYLAALAAPSEDIVKSFPAPANKALIYIREGAALYDNSDFVPSAANIDAVRPGRDFQYLGQYDDAYIVGYPIDGTTWTVRAMFAKKADASNIRSAPDETPFDAEALATAARTARSIALQDAAEATSKAIGTLPR